MKIKINHTIIVVIGVNPITLLSEGKIYKKATLQKLYQFLSHRFKRIDGIDVLNKVFQDPSRYFTLN